MKTSLRDNMETLTAQEFKDQLHEVIAQANQTNKQFKVESAEGSIIVLAEETFQNILVTLELLSTPGLMDQLRMANESEIEIKDLHTFSQDEELN